MTLIIEDGSQVANSNSYISVVDFEAYAAVRGITISGTSEALLIQAMDYLESLQFIGLKVSSTQSLQWPRSGVVIDGYAFASDDIPNELIKGQCEVAISIDQGNGPLAVISRAKKRVKAGAVEVEYSDSAASTNVVRTISASLYKLLSGSGVGGNNISVNRA